MTIYGQSLPSPWQPLICFPSLWFCLLQNVPQIKCIVCSLPRLASLIRHAATGDEAGATRTQRVARTVAASGLGGAWGPRRTGAAVGHREDVWVYGRREGSHWNIFGS